MPSYSIVILHYGDPAVTVSCLASTGHLEPPPRERIVVWNDPRGTPGGDALARQLENVRRVDPGENLGFAAGCNLGVEEALRSGADAVWMLNNDTVVDPGAVSPLLDALAGDPRAALCGPRILRLEDGRIWNDGGEIRWPEGKAGSRQHGGMPAERAADAPDFICGCAMMARGDAFREAGGFDPRYFFSYEDVDLSLRLRRRGWNLIHVPSARIWHRSDPTAADSPAGRYYRTRNRLLFIADHAPDAGTARRAGGRVRRRALLRGVRLCLTARVSEGRALLGAVRDAGRGRWGRRARYG